MTASGSSSSAASVSSRWSLVFVAMVVASVALLDVATGAYLSFAADPTAAHGDETLWTTLAPTIRGEEETSQAVISLFRRIGAFQLFAGLMSLIWLGYGLWRQADAITVLLGAYLGVGIIFFWVDRSFFAKTDYFIFKQIIGAVWAMAFVVHLRQRRIDLGA